MIKRTIQQEDMTLVNIYALNIAPEYVKQILMDKKGEDWQKTRVIVGNFNTPLTSKDRYSRQKINKETVALYDTLDQMGYIDPLIQKKKYNKTM